MLALMVTTNSNAPLRPHYVSSGYALVVAGFGRCGTERTGAVNASEGAEFRKDCHRRTACVRYERVCRRPAGSRYQTAGSSCVTGAAPSPWPTASREHRWSTSLHCASRTLGARRPVFAQGGPVRSARALSISAPPDPQAATTPRHKSTDHLRQQSTQGGRSWG